MASTKGPKENANATTTRMTPEQKGYFDKALNLYGNQLGENNVYGGQRVAPFSDLQNEVFNFDGDGGFMWSPEQTNEYFDKSIKEPAVKNFNESTMPAVKEAFSGPGYWGSARAKEEVKANKDLNDYLNTAFSNLNWQVKEANQAGAEKQFNLGSTQQQQSQNVLNAAMQKFAEDNQITDPTNLQILMSLLGMGVTQTVNGSKQTTTPSWHSGDWTNAGTAAGIDIAKALMMGGGGMGM